jgi:hypothetical protein
MAGADVGVGSVVDMGSVVDVGVGSVVDVGVGSAGMSSKFAVAVTAFAGMVKLALAPAASLNVTDGSAVQCVNRCPAGGVPALIFTVAPSA